VTGEVVEMAVEVPRLGGEIRNLNDEALRFNDAC